MKKICANCKKEINPENKIFYTLDHNLLSKPCCSLKCAKLFKENTILNLKKEFITLKTKKSQKDIIINLPQYTYLQT